MATIQSLADSIAQMEGFNVPNSLAQRNNNPGNIRFVGQAGAVKGDGGFARFPTLDAGWQALYGLIGKRANQGMTLATFMSSYAPPSENNTNNYIDFVSKRTGIGPDELLTSGFRRG